MTTMINPPSMLCRNQPKFDPSDWSSVAAAFAAADACAMQQAWLAEPLAGFRPASVRVGHDDVALWIFANLRDDDPFNPETRFNAPAFTRGDAFEIFLRPQDQEAYCEFHVTPENQIFQLRIPSAAAFATIKMKSQEENPCLIPTPVFDHWTRVDRAGGCWEVLARIPFKSVAESGAAPAGTRWLFSFCRYDYTRGNPTPVLASTSPHPVCNFHRQTEWGTLTME